MAIDTSNTINSASDIQMDYMKLLVTQLQNQNPLEPMDNNQMADQLTAFSQLQQIEGMNKSFAEVLELTTRSYANSLLGKQVTFFEEDAETGAMVKSKGTVASVFNDNKEGEVLLGVHKDGDALQDYTLGLDAVILVENDL